MKEMSANWEKFGNNMALIEAHKITKMILVLVGIFAFCNTFQVLNQWIQSDIVECIGDLLLTINSSINGIIYGIFNKKFREAFLSCNSSLSTSDATFGKRKENIKLNTIL